MKNLTELQQQFASPQVRFRSHKPLVGSGPVVYWMQRAQRGDDNPALELAIAVANALQVPIAVFFAPRADYPDANARHYLFLMQGVAQIAKAVTDRNALFVFRQPPDTSLARFVAEVGAQLVIGDENPLRGPAQWREQAAQRLLVPLWTVDADVIVPTQLFAGEPYAARTLRPRIHQVLDNWLQPLANQRAQVPWSQPLPASAPIDAPELLVQRLGPGVDHSVPASASLRGGAAEARRRLAKFVETILGGYGSERGDPSEDGTSKLSAYLHFGQLSPLTVALAVHNSDAKPEGKQAFLEQLVVRRELAWRFVQFNPRYDSLDGCEPWALRTLAAHRNDPRPWLYHRDQLEQAQTHDPAWNAAQRQMLMHGWMHNYMRMYWAKKILEWSKSPEEAFANALYLNDKYQLDGRDPNGFTGVAWSIGGKHDRPWAPERPVYGSIRYMNDAGLRRKFHIDLYIRQHRA